MAGIDRAGMSRALLLLSVGMVVPPLAFAGAFRLSAFVIELHRGAGGAGGMSGLVFVFFGPPLVLLSVVACYLLARTWVVAIGVVANGLSAAADKMWAQFLAASNSAVNRLTAVLVFTVLSMCAVAFCIPIVFTDDTTARTVFELAAPTALVLPVLVITTPAVRRAALPALDTDAEPTVVSSGRAIATVTAAATMTLTMLALLLAHAFGSPANIQDEPTRTNILAALTVNLAAVLLALTLLAMTTPRQREILQPARGLAADSNSSKRST